MSTVQRPELTHADVCRMLGLPNDRLLIKDRARLLERCDRCAKTFMLRGRGDGAVYEDQTNGLRLCNVCLTTNEWERVMLALRTPMGPFQRVIMPWLIPLVVFAIASAAILMERMR